MDSETLKFLQIFVPVVAMVVSAAVFIIRRNDIRLDRSLAAQTKLWEDTVQTERALRDKAEKHLSAAESTISDYITRINGLGNDLAQAKVRLEALPGLEERVAHLEKQVEEQAAEIKELRNDNTKLKRENGVLATENGGLQKENSRLKVREELLMEIFKTMGRDFPPSEG